MKEIIQSRMLRLSAIYKELENYSNSEKSTLQKHFNTITVQHQHLDPQTALQIIKSALVIEHIYFRILPIIYYYDHNPETSDDTQYKITQQIKNIYQEIQTQYLDFLVKNSTGILNAYNALQDRPNVFYTEGGEIKTTPTRSQYPATKISILDYVNSPENQAFHTKARARTHWRLLQKVVLTPENSHKNDDALPYKSYQPMNIHQKYDAMPPEAHEAAIKKLKEDQEKRRELIHQYKTAANAARQERKQIFDDLFKKHADKKGRELTDQDHEDIIEALKFDNTLINFDKKNNSKLNELWKPIKQIDSDKELAQSRLIAFTIKIWSLRAKGRNIDASFKNTLDQIAQQKYRDLKSTHEPINIWLKIVSEANKKTQENLKIVFKHIQSNEDQTENMGRLAVIIAACIFIGPAGGAIDPVLSLLKDIGSKIIGNMTAATGPTGAVGAKSASDAVRKQLQGFNKTVKLVGHEDPVKAITHYLESRPPNAILELMQAYVDYKINGQAKEFSEMFLRSQLWDGENPIHIIRSRRRELMEQYKSAADETRWDGLYSTNAYDEIYDKLNTDLIKEFTHVIETIFDNFLKQYESTEGLLSISEYIKKQTFDDSKVGLASFESGKYNNLINTLENEIALSILVRFAITYLPGWGGSSTPSEQHLQAVADRSFVPTQDGSIAILRDKRTDYINNEIIKRYHRRFTNQGIKIHNPFADYDTIEDLRCHQLNTRYTPRQKARFDKMSLIVSEYFTTELNTRLFTTIETQQPNSTPYPKTPQSQADTTPHKHLQQGSNINIVEAPFTGIDRIHDWKSEANLREEGVAVLRPFILAYQSDLAMLRFEEAAISGNGNESGPMLRNKITIINRTPLNQFIEHAKDLGTPKKKSSQPLSNQNPFNPS